MENVIYYNELFEIYSPLLTDNERETFKDYYFEDLSLSEISENKGVSRAAIQKTLKVTIKKLEDFENNLHKHEIIKSLKDILLVDDKKMIKERITEIIEKE